MSILRRLLGGQTPDLPVPLPYEADSAEGLAARWVQWAAAAGPMNNPVQDATGKDGGVNQPGDVWFLAGTFGGDVERHVAVPSGRPLFFPAFNMWTIPADGPPEALGQAFGEVWVNGEQQAVRVIATPVPFHVTGARLNPVTGTRKPVPATVWGLWAHLEPPAPGAHSVFFRGGDGFGFTVSAKYHLTVG